MCVRESKRSLKETLRLKDAGSWMSISRLNLAGPRGPSEDNIQHQQQNKRMHFLLNAVMF